MWLYELLLIIEIYSLHQNILVLNNLIFVAYLLTLIFKYVYIYRIPKDAVIPLTTKHLVFQWCPPLLHPSLHPRTPPRHHPVMPPPATPPCHQLPAAVADGRRQRQAPVVCIRQPASNKWHRRLAPRHKCQWRPALTVPCPRMAALAQTVSRYIFPGLPTASQITSTTTMLTV